MKRQLISGAALAALLVTFAVSASAESSAKPPRRVTAREHNVWRGGGVQDHWILKLHGGLSMPTGDYADAFGTGWGGGMSVGYGVSRNVLLSGAVAYHRFDGQLFSDDHSSITPWTMGVEVRIPTEGTVKPWVGGGFGLYHYTFTEPAFVAPLGIGSISVSENDPGINLGMGIAMPVSPRAAFGAGFKFHHVFGNDFIDADFLTLQTGFALTL